MGKLSKTEFWVAIAGGVATVATALIDSGVLAPMPKTAAIVGLVAIAASYIAGRSWVKGHEARARELSIMTGVPDTIRMPRNGAAQ